MRYYVTAYGLIYVLFQSYEPSSIAIDKASGRITKLRRCRPSLFSVPMGSGRNAKRLRIVLLFIKLRLSITGIFSNNKQKHLHLYIYVSGFQSKWCIYIYDTRILQLYIYMRYLNVSAFRNTIPRQEHYRLFLFFSSANENSVALVYNIQLFKTKKKFCK